MEPIYVTLNQAKILKEKGFDIPVDHFYLESGQRVCLKPFENYKHLYVHDKPLEYDFTGKYNWNSLNENETLSLKTPFSECYDWYNCKCSSPEQWEVIEWLRIKHNIHIEICLSDKGQRNKFFCRVIKIGEYFSSFNGIYSDTPFEAYSNAFDYILPKL